YFVFDNHQFFINIIHMCHSLITDQTAVFDFVFDIGDPILQHFVMGDKDDGGRMVYEHFLQCLKCMNVEKVRRFIQHQHLDIRHQNLDELDFHTFTAADDANFPMDSFSSDSESREHRSYGCFIIQAGL